MTQIERRRYNALWQSYTRHCTKPEYGGPVRSKHHIIARLIDELEARGHEPCQTTAR